MISEFRGWVDMLYDMKVCITALTSGYGQYTKVLKLSLP